MRIGEVMSRDVRMVKPDETLCDAARTMAEIDAGVLPVGDGDRLVGMITDRDIAIRGVAKRMPPTAKVRDVMSKEVLYCFDDQDCAEVAKNMSEVKVRRMPVVNRDKRLVGIVSLADLARKEDESRTGETVRDISAPGGAHSQRMH